MRHPRIRSSFVPGVAVLLACAGHEARDRGEPEAPPGPVEPGSIEQLIDLAGTIVGAAPVVARVWPGFWPPEQAFILAEPGRHVLLFTTDDLVDGFEPLRAIGGGILHVHHGAIDGLAASRGRFDISYDIGSASATAVSMRADPAATLLLLYHEAFHAFQRREFAPRARPAARRRSELDSSPRLAALAEVERRALTAALAEPDPAGRDTILREYLAVRAHRFSAMPLDEVELERVLERIEGTAEYVSWRATAAALGWTADRIDAELREHLAVPIHRAVGGAEWNIRQRVYAVGAALGLVMDRQDILWHHRLQAGDAYDDVLADALGPSDGSGAAILERALSRFGYPDLLNTFTGHGSSAAASQQAPDTTAILIASARAGAYRFCDLPGGGSARLAAAFLDRAGEEARIDIPATGPVFQELAVALDAPSRVVGQVVDAETGRPVAGVTVRLAGVAGERVSGRDGRFVFPGVGPGHHALEARHLAYHTVEGGLRVDGTGRTLQLEVRLAAGAIPLDPIVVTVDSRPMSATLRNVYDRIDRVRLTGGGTVFDRRDIERRNPARVTHLLSEVRGVQVTTFSNVPILTSTRAFSGWGLCLMTVWVDGVMAFRGGTAGVEQELGNPPTNINDLVAVSNIEAIEVYHAGGRIPEEYWGSAAGCGVVLIWSRRET